MPEYRRALQAYFFIVVTHRRRPFLTDELARGCLRSAWREVRGRRPFQLDAVCLLPDHLHTVWTPPNGDSDYSGRRAAIKSFVGWIKRSGSTEHEPSEAGWSGPAAWSQVRPVAKTPRPCGPIRPRERAPTGGAACP